MKKNQNEQYFSAHTVVMCEETVTENVGNTQFQHSEIYYG